MKRKNMSVKFGRKIVKGYRELGSLDKRLLWTFIGVFMCLAILNFSISTYYSFAHGDIINKEECKQVGINVYHQLNDMKPYERFIFEYKPVLAFLIFAIGLGWIFHGVGFKIIG